MYRVPMTQARNLTQTTTTHRVAFFKIVRSHHSFISAITDTNPMNAGSPIFVLAEHKKPIKSQACYVLKLRHIYAGTVANTISFVVRGNLDSTEDS